MLFEAYGGRAMKTSSALECHTRFAYRNHKAIQFLSLSWMSSVQFTSNSFSKAKQSTKLIVRKYRSGYVKLRLRKVWTLGQGLDSPTWQCSSSEGALCKEVCAPKINYRNICPTLFPLLAPNDFWLFPKIRSTLKGRIFEDIEDIQKNVMTALNLIPQQEFQKCF
jgi:hypothetical protein